MVCWKADELVSLGTAISDFVASQSVQEALKQWAAHTALAGALVASFAWPLVALSAMAPVDNAWSVALQRAEVTGALLARLAEAAVLLVDHGLATDDDGSGPATGDRLGRTNTAKCICTGLYCPPAA